MNPIAISKTQQEELIESNEEDRIDPEVNKTQKMKFTVDKIEPVNPAKQSCKNTKI